MAVRSLTHCPHRGKPFPWPHQASVDVALSRGLIEASHVFVRMYAHRYLPRFRQLAISNDHDYVTILQSVHEG